MNRLSCFATVCALFVLSLGPVRAAEPAAGQAIPLPAADRGLLDELLGPGVVGDAVAAKPLPPSSKFLPIRDTSWTVRIVGGDKSGTTQQVTFAPIKGDGSGATGTYSVGTKTVYYIRQSGDGDLSIVSEEDRDQGVIVRYAPPEPIVLAGMNPGESRNMTVGVKVYDLGDPTDLSHQGSMDVTYSYIGAYTVTVPAGTYDAALIKWTYTGSVGPANIEDTQYRFLAEDVGIVASVDKKDITAMLVYNDQSKFGKVLVKAN